MFRRGDIIELASEGYAAKRGAKAVVVTPLGEASHAGCMEIRWDEKDPRRKGQTHGHYGPKEFRLALPDYIPRFKQVAGEL